MREKLILPTALALMLSLQLASPHKVETQSTEPIQVVVHQLDGSDYTHALATIGKFTLTDSKLCLVTTDGQLLELCPTSNLRSLTFETKPTNPTALNNTLCNEITVTLAPNPTAGSVIISGAADGAAVNVFDLSGHIVHRGAAPTVDLTSLPNGVYLLQVETQVVKVIRK